MVIKIEKNDCTPCKMVGQFLNSNNIEHKIENIDIDPKVIEKYNIMSVPVVIKLDDNGEEIDRVVGFDIRKLEQLLL